jgi:hypothetical protein
MSAKLLPRFHISPRQRVTDVCSLHLHLEQRFAMIYAEETAVMLRREFSQ